MSKRRARNKLEIDLLPPFGVPEVNFYGDVALVAGTILALGFTVKKIQNR